MEEKLLGKITRAEFGLNPDRPFLYGLELDFEMVGSGVGTSKTVNISDNCKWENLNGRMKALEANALEVSKILADAKVSYISQLKGKPVEVTLEGNMFKSFRILTEVL